MRIAHISDTHIRNYERQDQYKESFKDLYRILRKEKPDYIVHCGDIAHKKTVISPEFVELCSDFFRNLESIAPTYIILGNHDGNLRNSDRQDALSPIVDALSLKDLYLLKNSGECVLDDVLTLNVMSIFDEENWMKPTDPSKINIALYHGGIRGSQTDIGWDIKVDHDVNVFDGFDFAFLGDIHKSNQVLDVEGRVRYPGSTIQQDHGETPDKGFLIWDIEDRDSFDVRHIILKDPNPHLDINLTKAGRLPAKLKIPENARVRVVANNKISISQQRRILDIVRKRFNPQRITFKNKNLSGNSGEIADGVEIGNLRSLDVQEKLIKDYLSDYNVADEILEEVIELNGKYNAAAEAEEEVHRNINWSVEKLEWDNLFNYGGENIVNFASLNGIVGIFGKNYSGKSSVIDSLLFTMSNSTSKSSVKNVSIINQNKDNAISKISLSVGNTKYFIERKVDKYVKRLKGKETTEASVVLDFWSEDQVTGERANLNGETRFDTDANIRKIFGTKEDFLMTSFCSQMDSLQFVNQGSTDRKKSLSKFLDLDLFEKKHRMVKEETSYLYGALKQVENKDYDEDVKAEKVNLRSADADLTAHKDECGIMKASLRELEDSIRDIDISIASYPKIDIDIDTIRERLGRTEKSLASAAKHTLDTDAIVAEKREYLIKVDKFVDSVSYDDLREKKETIREGEHNLASLLAESEKLQLRKDNMAKKVSLLSEVPCGDKYPTCKFLQDALSSRKEITGTSNQLIGLNRKSLTAKEELDLLGKDSIERQLEKYQNLLSARATTQKDISNILLEKVKDISDEKDLQREMEGLREKEKEYLENEKDCQIIFSFKKRRKELEQQSLKTSDELEHCEEEMHLLIQKKGSCEQKIDSLRESKAEQEDLKRRHIAYDLLKSCMDPNGISSDIIKKCLPIINEEINKGLVGIVPYEVSFEIEERKLEVYIRHPKYEPRIIETASGAEKTISAMAIRLALTKVGNLPKSDIFILDEPATDLDSENMEGFLRILEMLKSQFKTVILISHLDALKECVDSEIVIEKKNGFAHVSA